MTINTNWPPLWRTTPTPTVPTCTQCEATLKQLRKAEQEAEAWKAKAKAANKALNDERDEKLSVCRRLEAVSAEFTKTHDKYIDVLTQGMLPAKIVIAPAHRLTFRERLRVLFTGRLDRAEAP